MARRFVKVVCPLWAVMHGEGSKWYSSTKTAVQTLLVLHVCVTRFLTRLQYGLHFSVRWTLWRSSAIQAVLLCVRCALKSLTVVV